jgi:hypothetical protein
MSIDGKENILENMFAETFSENLSELLKSVMSYVPMLIYCFQSTAQEDFGGINNHSDFSIILISRFKVNSKSFL